VKFGGNPSSRKLEAEKQKEKDKKKPEDDPLSFDAIFKPVAQAQKIEKGKTTRLLQTYDQIYKGKQEIMTQIEIDLG